MDVDARVRDLEAQVSQLEAALADATEVKGECWRGSGAPAALRPVLRDDGLFWRCTHGPNVGGPHDSNRVDQ